MNNAEHMERLLPFWRELDSRQQELLINGSVSVSYRKGALMHRNEQGCAGMMLILSGQLRTYILSEEGREVTLFRVRKGDVCVLSATCLMDAIEFDVLMDAVEDTEVLLIPSVLLESMLEEHPKIEVYLYKTATERFAEVMWTMQQILFMGVDKRIAVFLWEEIQHESTKVLTLTHDEIARLIGSAREVVTKALKYFAQEGVVSLSRGKIEILDVERLKKS